MHGLAAATLIATWEAGLGEGPVDRAVRLLATTAGVSEQDAARWDVGSRDAVLARLLRGGTGRVVWTRAGCGGCGSVLDVPVDLAGFAGAPVREPGAVLSVEVAGAAVRFRLPTSEDLRHLDGTDPARARGQLLERCLADGPPTSDLEGPVDEAVDAAMERACPAGAVRIGVTCPDCDATTIAALDVPVLAWAELEARAVALLAEVHTLAAAYGWSEAAVLALSPPRRAAYLELVGS